MSANAIFTYIIGLAIAYSAGFVTAVVMGIWKDSNNDKDNHSD